MKSYFNFSKKEKIGVVTLSSFILVLSVVLNVGFSTYVPDPFNVDMESIDFLVLNKPDSSKGDNESKKFDTNKYQSNNYKPNISNFDPNKIDVNKWISFGFSKKQAESIINYKENFGPFKKKQDIKKLYVVSDQKYAQLEPYIKIEKQLNQPDKTSPYEAEKNKTITTVNLELNTTTKDELTTLSGIGEYYANRIINYRKKTGGFIEFEQIKNMSIPDDVKAIIIELTTINEDEIQKKNINTASKNELKNIPYTNWLTVAAILKERELHNLTDLEFLTETEISNGDKEKLKLYIVFE